MKIDITRDTFHPERRYTRVLLQQGRVQIDADWNEQVAIFTQGVRSLAADWIGPHGGPEKELGFAIALSAAGLEDRDHEAAADLRPSTGDFIIGSGRYYVDGILVVNDAPVLYSKQPSLILGEEDLLTADPQSRRAYLVHLDVWEREVTFAQEPDIAEVALGGPDTAARVQVVWQVKAFEVTEPLGPIDKDEKRKRRAEELLSKKLARQLPGLKARVADSSGAGGACAPEVEARYRGLENQLYRVEIHFGGKGAPPFRPGTTPRRPRREPPRTGGPLAPEPPRVGGGATFKWSRDNATVVFPIAKLESTAEETTVTVRHLGRDARAGLTPGDWVELEDEDSVLRGRPGKLLRVAAVDPQALRVTLAGVSGLGIDRSRRALLRRWDQKQRKESAARVTERGVEIIEGEWIPLEDGVWIWFTPGAEYRTGDYWLIPARAATGQLEWPGTPEDPGVQPPAGIEHHVAPLAFIRFSAQTAVNDVRRRFPYQAR